MHTTKTADERFFNFQENNQTIIRQIKKDVKEEKMLDTCNQLTKERKSVFYGYFLNYDWRDEKNGNSYFRFVTNQMLLHEKQYRSKKVVKNSVTGNDEIWFVMCCDGTHYHVPFFESKTPIKIEGYFKNEHDHGYGWEFQITNVKEGTYSEIVTIQYLESELFPEITHKDAVEIVKKFGADIFTFVQKRDAKEQLLEHTQLQESVIDFLLKIIRCNITERKLFESLAPFGVARSSCLKIVQQYGERAIYQVKRDPYGFGKKLGLEFQQCDDIATKYRTNGVGNMRIKAAAKQALDNLSQSGHTWSDGKQYYSELLRLLGNNTYQKYIPASLISGTACQVIGHERIDDKEIFFDQALKNAEERTVKNLKRLALAQDENEAYSYNLVSRVETECHIHLGNQQASAFPCMLKNRGVKLLTGGPGTGKTTTIRGLLAGYQMMYPEHKIRLCAPTGRAAQRMAESTGMPAVTIHRLLDYRPYGESVSHKDASNPIDADLIVVDEMSMTDVVLFDLLLDAIKTGTILILVGDTNQLESVGPGAVLHDLMQTDENLIPKCRLTEVFRQKGGSPIISNAIRINEGKTSLETRDDFQIIKTKSEEETMEKVVSLMQELYNPLDPFETQILCPSKKGIVGIDQCNKVLQDLLNPGSKALTYGSTQYRIHDKIIMMNNNYEIETPYYNGDIGIVEDIQNNKLVVNIRDEKIVLSKDMMKDIQLSYGMTIHKSQGSEFKNVIVVMPMNPSNMLVRNLLYTAVTRAKARVFIINEGSAMETAIKVNHEGERRTFMCEYLSQKN